MTTLTTVIRPPCDEAAIRARAAVAPAPRHAEPWILASDDPRLEHGVHRRHGGERRAAGAASRASARRWRTCSGWSRRTRSSSRRCSWSAARWAIASAGGASSRSASSLFAAGLDRLRPGARASAIDRRRGAVQGVGGALLVPGSLAIISASFDEARRGRAIGTWSGFTRDHHRARPGAGRLAGRARLVARGLLPQRAAGAGVVLCHRCARTCRRAGTRHADRPARLARRGAGDAWVWAALVFGLIESARRRTGRRLVLARSLVGVAALVAVRGRRGARRARR